MDQSIREIAYPTSFREDDARVLGEHVRLRHSVDIIGMKRVGISNFLRFFLYQKEIVKTYISKEDRYLFIPVDLNDLVEREIYPFWSLTLKRIVDTIGRSDLPGIDQKRIESLFLNSIQSQDLLLVIDSVREAIAEITAINVTPTLFFLRFDRMKDVVTPQFFSNLQGLRDATHQKLSYVFTSYRSLESMSPAVFDKTSLSVFSKSMYIKPANKDDLKTIHETYLQKYELKIPSNIEESLLTFANGYVQYLQLALIILNEKRAEEIGTKESLFELLIKDERIILQSEELYESLSLEEKEIVRKVQNGFEISDEERRKAIYLWETGFVYEAEGRGSLFSPIFANYLEQKQEKGVEENPHNVHFSKKEHLLYTLLESNKNKICERESIVEVVWPEYKEFGVSDWAIDRLVARVRVKVKQQNSPYKIVTVRTRGYTLVTA